MKKKTSLITILVLIVLMVAALSSSVFAAPRERGEGFVCPVFNTNSQAGHKNPNAVGIAGGDFTIIGPEVKVPIHATNDNGNGSSGGAHVSPGDKNYTPIWEH